MVSANEKLLNAAISHEVDLHRYSDSVIYRIIAVLNRSDSAMATELALKLEGMTATNFSMERLEGMLYSVRSLNREAYAQVERELTAELRDFAQYELAFQRSALVSVLPVQISVVGVSVEAVAAAALSRPFQGGLLKEFLRDMEDKKARIIRQTIADGYVQGKTTGDIVRSIRGTKAKGYSDGVIEITRRDAQAVVRTALSHMAARTRQAVADANSDLIKGYMWLATLDLKTSSPCRARDQKQYDKAFKPIGHSFPWGAGPGALHWNSVVEGTLVSAERGLIPIESVIVGDRVLTHNGRYKLVLALGAKQCDSGVVRVVHAKSGRVLRATDDHPILTVRSGWKFVGTLEIGDELFSDPESLLEVGSVTRKINPKPKDGPASTDDQSVALLRTIQLVAANINFKGDFEVCASEIENSAADVVLSDPAWIKRDECAKHHFFALSHMLSKCGRHRLSQIFSGLHGHWDAAHSVAVFDIITGVNIGLPDAFGNTGHVGRIAGCHSDRMTHVGGAGVLCHSPRPMEIARWRDAVAGRKITPNLLKASPNGDVVFFGEVGQAPVRKAEIPFDSPKGVSGDDVILSDDAGVLGFGFIHDPIITLEVQTCSSRVYDLSVEGDCSYVASGIVVSNCRSISVNVLKSLKELTGLDIADFTPTERASMDGVVPADTDYGTWIRGQSAARQDEVLGPSRGRLMRSGGLSLDEMYSAKGTPLTLVQLRERYAAEFIRAGV